MFGKLREDARVKATEMEEAERATVDMPPAVDGRQSTLAQVPIGDVKACVTRHVDTVAEARHEIHELLVYKDAERLIVDTLILKPTRPPSQDLVGLVPSSNAKKAEIVGTGLHDANVTRILVSSAGRQRCGVRTKDVPPFRRSSTASNLRNISISGSK